MYLASAYQSISNNSGEISLHPGPIPHGLPPCGSESIDDPCEAIYINSNTNYLASHALRLASDEWLAFYWIACFRGAQWGIVLQQLILTVR